ncbi:MAG: hypothetical protein MUF15_13100 [Acidobacteria bacterium]|jgi:hypothetical protein|nr:hypothetical protein [Acidobacteriota bacterium]
MEKKTFEIIILNGRPAAGKSEVIDYLKKMPVEERMQRFHIGDFVEIDDFPFLWEDFEDDDLMEEMGLPRLISDKTFNYQGKTYNGYVFKEKWYWNFLIKKINRYYRKLLRNKPTFHKDSKTAILEFSRGSEHGGFKGAYNYLDNEILQKAVTLYIKVDFEESMRKNRRRYNPDKPDSILEHALEDIKMEKLYKDSDWEEFAADPQYLQVKDFKIPYAVFDNMPEKTDKPDILGAHLEEVLNRLWKVYQGK